ncbi:MAG TPA: hypothetical protein VM262_07270 [Acidimicrobiales bacterium]|nr:hypothetical protein [Acidimicrobiales bacterium]
MALTVRATNGEDVEVDRLSLMLEVVARVQALPYVWPCPPTAASAREAAVGSCASKHALLREELDALGIASRPMFVVGVLVPELLADDPEIAAGAGLLEVHECLTASVPDVGPCVVDVTWDPPLLDRGLLGTRDWDGRSDMAVAAADPVGWWAPDPARLRTDKEALRARLYDDGDRQIRDRVLAAMAARFAEWRR